MPTTTTIDLLSVTPLDRMRATELGGVEYRRMADALAALEAHEWNAPTDCDGWTVRHMAAHLYGAVTSAMKIRNSVAEQRAVAKRVKQTGENEVDAMTALQIETAEGRSHAEIVAHLRDNADAAVAGRRRMPGFVARRMKIPVVMNTIDETWTLDYLLGPILTRDTFLHRVNDLARAVGRAPVLDDHDREIVADVAAEWARRHGQPVELTLTGAAGGRYRSGSGGPEIELDAIDFCRILSRRADATHPLLEVEVPF